MRDSLRQSRGISWRPVALTSALLLAAVLVLAGCGGSASSASNTGSAATTAPTATTAPAPTDTPAAAATQTTSSGGGATVKIDGAFGNFKFDPGTITIKVGTSVTWMNTTSAPHTATSDSGAPASFDSGAINASSGTFSFTFTKPGTYNYHCSYHSYMHATIVVTA